MQENGLTDSAAGGGEGGGEEKGEEGEEAKKKKSASGKKKDKSKDKVLLPLGVATLISPRAKGYVKAVSTGAGSKTI